MGNDSPASNTSADDRRAYLVSEVDRTMNAKTRAAFVEHVRMLEAAAIAGDMTASKSLACMALLQHDGPPDDPGDGEIIDLMPYLKLVAA